jgi:hypothetical protein
VSSKCCGASNKEKLFLNKAPFMENVQLTVSNQYSIFEEDNIEEDCIFHSVGDNNVIKNNLHNRNQFINREEFKEQNKVINNSEWNQSDLQEIQCIQGLSHLSHDTGGKRCFKILSFDKWFDNNE